MIYWSAEPVCASAHPLCSRVGLHGNLTLEESESLLGTLFRDVERAVENGTLTPQCGRAFPLLYCHQVYERCTPVSNSSEYDAEYYLCEDECSEAMSKCQQADWWLLSDLVEALAMPDLPPPAGNCSTGEFVSETNCVSITSVGE